MRGRARGDQPYADPPFQLRRLHCESIALEADVESLTQDLRSHLLRMRRDARSEFAKGRMLNHADGRSATQRRQTIGLLDAMRRGSSAISAARSA
jgi:hypothetical protein